MYRVKEVKGWPCEVQLRENAFNSTGYVTVTGGATMLCKSTSILDKERKMIHRSREFAHS